MGRKRHLLVDTLGLVLQVVVHPANVQDRKGGRRVLKTVKGRLPRLSKIWADQGCSEEFARWAEELLVQSDPQALDRGADVCVVDVPTSTGEGLRVSGGNGREPDLLGDDPTDGEKTRFRCV
jgi:hypothetical protein